MTNHSPNRPFLWLLLLVLSCQSQPTPTLPDAITIQLDTLGTRYLELGRFSGCIYVEKAGNKKYQAYFGLANYADSIPFTQETAFKIGTLSAPFASSLLGANQQAFEQTLKEQGLQNTHLGPTEAPQATGYLYHNYRGKGLELQATPSLDSNQTADHLEIVSTPADLAQVARTKADESFQIHGYLENGGFSYSLVKEQDQIIIILSNRRHPVSEEMSRSISALLTGKPYQIPLPRKPQPVSSVDLNPLVGNYQLNEQVRFTVLARQDSLFVQIGPNAIYLYPQSKNQFYLPDQDAEMRFLRDSNGAVNEVLLLNGFMESEQRAVRAME